MRKYQIIYDNLTKEYCITGGIRFIPYFLVRSFYLSHSEYYVDWHNIKHWRKKFMTFEEAKATLDEIIKPRKKRFVIVDKYP